MSERHTHRSSARVPIGRAVMACVSVALVAVLSSCSAGSQASDTTTGSDWSEPTSVAMSTFHAEGATSANDSLIDVSSVSDGYVGASATSTVRMKFLVESGQMSYAYDLPQDGTPIICPINMGDGTYTFRVMRNTTGNQYVELNSVTIDVTLTSEFAPYLVPNVYCDYDTDSACVAKARELCADATNEGDVVRAVFDYITENVTYDTDKAQSLADATGYVPDPDETLADGKGICFDYASLGAAMLRSLGIPCKVITGYVSPDGIYHAWIMVYIDGSWTSTRISVEKDTWSRIDLTFAASSDSTGYVGDGNSYTDRYTY